MCGHGTQELDYIAAGNQIHTNGCIDKLVNWIHSNLFMLGGVALGLAIPQVGYGAHKHTYRHTHTHTLKPLRVETNRPSQLVSPLFVFSLLQLVGILLSQILINQIKDQIELQNYNLKHHSDPWSWPRPDQTRFWWTAPPRNMVTPAGGVEKPQIWNLWKNICHFCLGWAFSIIAPGFNTKPKSNKHVDKLLMHFQILGMVVEVSTHKRKQTEK